MRTSLIGLASCLALLCFTGGCGSHSAAAPPKPPEVTVAPAISARVVDFDDYTGRIQAMETVELRARVSGYLTAVRFQDGDLISEFKERHKDDPQPLFEIDSSTYQAAYEQALAQVALEKARYENAKATRDRNQPLFVKGAIAKEEYENLVTAAAQADAAMKAAEADARLKKLDVDFSRVWPPFEGQTVDGEPIDGKMDRAYVTEGNLVQAGPAASLLTRIVTVDPIYVYFDVDELAFLRYTDNRKAEEGGAIRLALRDKQIPVQVTLADGSVYGELGVIDFATNQLDAATGTITARAILRNRQKVLTPGLFVRVRVSRGQPYEAVLVADSAIGTDQSEKFVYVVNANNEAERRPVKTGTRQGALRVITEGLQAGERVVISGLLLVRDKQPVNGGEKDAVMPNPPAIDENLLRQMVTPLAEPVVEIPATEPASSPIPSPVPTSPLPHQVRKPIER